MAAFICRSCKAETNKLIYPTGFDDCVCPSCYVPRNVSNINLHMPMPGSQRKGLTVGKAWEIDQRVISKDDGKTVLNRRTGKETQY